MLRSLVITVGIYYRMGMKFGQGKEPCRHGGSDKVFALVEVSK